MQTYLGVLTNINHQVLLNKLATTPMKRRIIKGWLKAGVIDGEVFYTTKNGTPQGGVISPLLANVALHGLEKDTKDSLAKDLLEDFKKKTGRSSNIKAQTAISIIRYADDFVVIHENKEIIMKAKATIEKWLANIGLKLKESKTNIVHSLNSDNGQKPGFDFLGYTIRQFPDKNKRRGYKSYTRPSKQGQKEHLLTIKKP